MKLLLALLSLAIAAPSFAAVTVTSPANGAITSSPVKYVATASSTCKKGVSAVGIYVDNVRVYLVQGSKLDTTVVLAPGTHRTVVQEWDGCNGTSTEVISVTVPVPPPPSPLPTPPPTAYTFSGLQNVSGNPGTWQTCLGSCTGAQDNCMSGGTSVGSGSVVPGVSSPSLSGASLQQVSACPVDNGYWDVLAYRKGLCAVLPGNSCASISNVLMDRWYLVPVSTGLQALEFDPDVYDGTYEEFMSYQFRYAGEGAGYIYLWNMAANSWEATTYPYTAAMQSTGIWHHLQSYTTVDQAAHTYTYETLVIDGTLIFQNLGLTYSGSPYKSVPNFNVQQQVDGNTLPGTNTVYHDKINVTVW